MIEYMRKPKMDGWMLFGIYLIIINLFTLIAGVIDRYSYEALWISYYVGIIQGIICIQKFHKPILNSIYGYLFIFQLGSLILHIIKLPLYLSYLDYLYWFNHIPHLLGFYIIVKKPFSVLGIFYGLFFLLIMLNLTWYILYQFNHQSSKINTTYQSEHIFVFGLAFVWLILLLFYCFKRIKNECK